jgi:hypothetical protein
VQILAQREMDRDRPVGDADLQRRVMVAEQRLELLAVIIGEQIGPGQRRAIYSYALRTRKSAGSMMRKLSVTVSQ